MLFPVKQQENKCPTEGTPGVKRIVSRECQTSIVYSPDYVSILQPLFANGVQFSVILALKVGNMN